jgi:hypothetical protein
MSKTKTITGITPSEINKKQWEWQTTTSPPVRIAKQWPDQRLPLDMKSPGNHKKIEEFDDQFSRRIDYED